MSDREQKRREAALRRRFGASPESRARVSQFLGQQTDWRGSCRRCGLARVGTLAELQAPCPKCGAST